MNRSYPEGDRPESASRIGSDLRAARERLGWEIDAVAEALRLKPAFIRAIEQGDIRNLPGTAYAVGFVRTYATALGLDPNEAIRRFRAEREDVNRKTELDFPAPVPSRGMPAGALVLVGAIIAIGGYVAWYHYSGRSSSTTETVDAVPAHLEPLAPPPAPKIASVTPPPAATAPVPLPAAAGPLVASTLPQEPDVSPSSAAAAVPPPLPTLPAPSTNMTVAAVTPPTVQATDGAASGTATAAPGLIDAGMVIQATADAWIEIKNSQGKVVYQAVMHPGDSYKVPDQPQLTLTTGNAAGTQVMLAGNVIGPLKGHVLHNIPLDADGLKAASGQSSGVVPPAVPAAAPAPTAQ
ncbi:helix-turn-helix domain-containing protein [Acidisoma cellulosilytica]|uniref:Helix-turn-helix domain-containing protein n=1 Tax=Acidisoma cellulosilyticum TaxID=2802395 RepID=A0A963Z1C8_9PROT|nr:RodZ domain-containing protein [Acidisoma cellulosilyticum]MCB8880851.1 helix-turn-helix domain-containing protein [Acidisoma cellulosilyticum]